MSTASTECRCNGKNRLFFKIVDNCIEVKCRDCSKKESEKQGKQMNVFHRYNIIGEEVETIMRSGC